MNRNIGTSRNDFDALFQVREVQLGADTLSVHIQGEGDEVDVSSSFTVSKETPFDSVGTGHESEF